MTDMDFCSFGHWEPVLKRNAGGKTRIAENGVRERKVGMDLHRGNVTFLFWCVDEVFYLLEIPPPASPFLSFFPCCHASGSSFSTQVLIERSSRLSSHEPALLHLINRLQRLADTHAGCRRTIHLRISALCFHFRDKLSSPPSKITALAGFG